MDRESVYWNEVDGEVLPSYTDENAPFIYNQEIGRRTVDTHGMTRPVGKLACSAAPIPTLNDLHREMWSEEAPSDDNRELYRK